MARYIDADAVVRKRCGNRCGCERYECGSDVPCEMVDMIESAPTLSPDDLRPVGKWNWTVEGDEDYEQFWVCSRCGAKMYFATNYCPNCGAKMEEVD